MRNEKKPGSAQELRDICNGPEIQAELEQLAKDIRRDARRLAPKVTGTLSRGIDIEEITDLSTGLEGFAVGWNDKAFYGQIVEEGREGVAPRPHLVPAAIKNGGVFQGREG